MNLLLYICIGLSCGAALGILSGMYRIYRKKGSYTEKQIAMGKKIWKAGSRILTYLTGLILILGLIWCVYFLIMGAAFPAQAEYANNMSELIVAVLTVVSIGFAFYEFIRRK